MNISFASSDPGTPTKGPVPADLLAEVFDAVSTGRSIDHVAAKWLVDGIAAAVKRGDSLDSTLGLSAPGQRSLQRQLFTMRRDMHLLRAVQLVTLTDEVSYWQRCERLAPLVRSFLSDTWPKVKRLNQTPDDWPRWRVELFEAARTDIELPTSARRLFDLTLQTTQCSLQGRKAMLLAYLLEPANT